MKTVIWVKELLESEKYCSSLNNDEVFQFAATGGHGVIVLALQPLDVTVGNNSRSNECLRIMLAVPTPEED